MQDRYVMAGPVSKIELSISCTELLKKDITSKSDPLCLLETYDAESKSWYEIGRTEKIKNESDPVFSKKFSIDYYFEEAQNLRFKIYDVDNETDTLKDDDYLGKLKCTLGSIVSAKTFQQPLFLKGKKQAGKSKIKIVAEEVTDNNELVVKAKGKKLDNKDFMGKSDPYLEFWRENDDNTWSLAYRSEYIKNTLNPAWPTLHIPMQSLCKGNLHRKIQVKCYDWDKDGDHDLIGEFFTTVEEILKNEKEEYQCINEKKKKSKKSYKNSGIISFSDAKIEKCYSFLDYIFGGLQINFTVGVDFTGSNGDPRDPSSLHFNHSQYMNEYVQALYAVGNVVQDYDTDKLFPAFGFGAKIPPGEHVSHEFPLNFNPTNPYCDGVHGIVQAYKQAILRIKFWGPTNFSPIINHVARFAEEAQTKQATPQNYFVLLIITDGAITDVVATIQAIVRASELPMSIIIVGVGQADFTMMEVLDGDDGVLKDSTGKKIARDIVQFVPFRDFKKKGVAALAKAVLAEIPTQVTTYFRQKGMIPAAIIGVEL